MALEYGAGSDLSGRLRLSVVRLSRRLRSQRSEDSVSLTLMSALATLASCGPMSPRELAACERVRPPSMTRIIAALDARGLAVRREHPTDGRQSIIALTPAGARLLAAEVSAKERWLDKRLAELTGEQRAILAAAVEIIDRMASGE